ncbi:MAG: FAD-dependent oxidoreductase, partial [Clostridia bacterium]|nr:FAD-dependent oxidoreductase [Clostridia bacterium]
DSIHDTEWLRDELLRIAYGVWDFVKNDPENKEKYANWRLDWMGILPGKRESRRYIGDHILTECEIRAEGRFDDIVAYGGWPMDDHGPAGFRSPGKPNVNHLAPSPYGIPYRCMYSKNVENLFFAGRNISASHCAISSTRVMATCALIGQAVGAAAAVAVRDALSPRGVYEQKIKEVQQILMDDDCYLPFNTRNVSELTANAALNCAAPDAENLRNGVDRPVGDSDNGCMLTLGEAVEYDFGCEKPVCGVRIVWDSDLNRETMPRINGRIWNKNMLHNRTWHSPDFYVPKTMTKAYRIEGVKADGTVVTLHEEKNNYQRLNKFAIEGAYKAIRLIPTATWGNEKVHLFAFEVK